MLMMQTWGGGEKQRSGPLSLLWVDCFPWWQGHFPLHLLWALLWQKRPLSISIGGMAVLGGGQGCSGTDWYPSCPSRALGLLVPRLIQRAELQGQGESPCSSGLNWPKKFCPLPLQFCTQLATLTKDCMCKDSALAWLACRSSHPGNHRTTWGEKGCPGIGIHSLSSCSPACFSYVWPQPPSNS